MSIERGPGKACYICGAMLGMTPMTLDCGGDCLRCMALAGDGDCAKTAIEHLERQLDLVESALAQRVAAIDNLLPGAKHIPCDVGLINQALIEARPLLEEVHDPTT